MLDLLGSDCFAAVHAVLALGFGLRVLLAFPALPPANDRPHQSLVAAALTPAVLLAVVNSPTASAAALTAGLHVLRFPRQSRVLVPAAAAASACAALASLGTGSVSPLSAGLLVSFAVAAVACAGVWEAGAWYRRRGYSPVLPTTSGDRGEGGGPAPIVSRPVPPAMQNCSLLSLLYFHWMQPLVSKGRGRSLEMEDIPPLSTRLQSENVSTQFWQHWDAELLLNRADSRRPAAPVSPLEIDSPGRPAKVRRRPSLWRALGRTFGLRLALGGLLKAGNDVCVFLSPLLLQQIILHLQHASANPGDASNIPRGLGLAAALFIVTCAQSIFFNQYFGVMVVIQSQVAASLISTTFDKTCKLSSSALVAFSRGFVQNLMAVDARILADSVLYLNTLWSGILQVAVSLALLKRLLGWAATLAGVGLIVCCVPVQVLLIRVMKRTRELASACTDERVKIVGEALSSVGVVRYMAWERAFIGRILDARLAELRLVRLALYVQAVNSSMTTSIPIVLALIALSTYVLVGGKLDASVIFPAIALFQVLRPQMSLIPSVIISVTRSVAAASRISRFLLADDLPSRDQGDHAVPADEFERSDCDVIAKSASVAWDVGFGVTLGNISMELPRGSLTCIVGAVASGKTTCLAGLLGELPVVSGHIGVRPGRSISYCEQEPFIQNATLRENVLFGLPMDEVRYRRALRLSCLLADLKVLPAGDLTEIGGKGVNLSGGQKARASLARALYSNSDIVLLDAPLAAVDAHVGRFIWEKCIVGGMERRTRVLTTNHLQFAASSHVDCVAVLEHGVLVEFGRRADLMADPSSAFSILVASQRTPAPATASPAAEGAAEVGGGDGGGGGGVGDEGASVLPKGHDGDDEAEDGIMLGTAGGSGNTAGTAPARLDASASSERGRLVQVEGKSSGRVALRHYVKYMQATGGMGALALTVALFASSQAASLGTNVFLSVWSEESRLGGYADGGGTRGKLLAYAGISVLAAALPAMSNVAVTGMSIRASVLLHERLCTTVFASPSAWFDTTPVGRILNRFNASVDKVDNSLAFTLQSVVRISMNLISSFALIFYATPAFVFVAVPIGMCYLLVQSYYRNSAVDLRRLESVSRSPLYSHFGETLDGLFLSPFSSFCAVPSSPPPLRAALR
jgi:ABC-type multidrug transport system fused ATPase/permease subunit